MSRDCDGCASPKGKPRTFLMQNGGTETLCPACIGDSHGSIVSEVESQ